MIFQVKLFGREKERKFKSIKSVLRYIERTMKSKKNKGHYYGIDIIYNP